MASDIARLEGFGTRVTGYKGCYAAAAWVENRLRDIGFTDIEVQEYDIPVPVALDRAECLRTPSMPGAPPAADSAFRLPDDELPLWEPQPDVLPEHAATLTLVGAGAEFGAGGAASEQEFVLHPLWPNLARTSQLPPDGVEGHLMYVGKGGLADYNNRDVEGAILLIDFNSGLNWLNAPLLGAAAVVFIEPDDTVRGEAETKFLRVPVSVPRFWIDGRSAMKLRACLSAANGGPPGNTARPLRGVLKCNMPWMERQGKNIIAFVPGRELAREAIVIEAYYDSISVVPSLAPGAENAAGLAAFLQLAKTLKQHPPRRSVILLATSGHFEAMAGAREFVDLWGKEPRKPREKGDRLEELQHQLRAVRNEQTARESETTMLLEKQRDAGGELKPEDASRLARLQGLARRLDRRRKRLEHDIALHQRLLAFERMPMFIAIDLNSRSPTFGAFQIGWYYQQQHLMRFYSPVGKRLMQYAEDIAAALGVAPGDVFIDGINPVKGREWYTHFPGKICFDSEMAIRGGRPGIAFATINDARPLVDTPLDRVERLNMPNLVGQTRMLVCLIHDFVNDETHETNALKRVKALKKLDELKDITGSVLEFRRK
ncbi:MAG: M28 family peptidase, partial [Armatimonadota bacterium]